MSQDFRLKQSFASNASVDLQDTRAVKRILNRLGYYIPPHDVLGMTRFPDRQVFEAVRAFQKDNGLFVNGELNPGDRTETAMNTALESQSPFDQYIWHTQQDDKVRGAHAAREGEMFSWSNPPDGGHPGEDYNCRCWAEPVQVASTDKNFVSASAKPRKCFAGGGWKNKLREMLQKWEQSILWPYLDSEGNITIGVGANVDNKAVFLALPLYHLDGKEATQQQKEEVYKKLKAFGRAVMKGGKQQPYKAKFFENMTPLRLRESTKNRLLEEKMEEAIAFLNRRFSDFNCFPLPARVALGDIAYNVRRKDFHPNPGGWPDLLNAVYARDWDAAAGACHRKGIDERRNTETIQLFHNAAQMERDAQHH